MTGRKMNKRKGEGEMRGVLRDAQNDERKNKAGVILEL
jgi:hypothetical protein